MKQKIKEYLAIRGKINVYVFVSPKDEIYGWKDVLGYADYWEPGTRAVDKGGNWWIAVGGSCRNGAEKWGGDMIPPELKNRWFMQELATGDIDTRHVKIIQDKITGHKYVRDHPVIQHDLIFKYKDRLYRTEYTIGMGVNPELPFIFEDPVVVEVEAVEVTRTEYRIKEEE